MGTIFNKPNDTDDWFLESPCCLRKIADIKTDIDTFVKEYVNEFVCLENGENEEEYIKNYMLPMIVDNVMYEIENFQCEPYLPEYVDDIKLIN